MPTAPAIDAAAIQRFVQPVRQPGDGLVGRAALRSRRPCTCRRRSYGHLLAARRVGNELRPQVRAQALSRLTDSQLAGAPIDRPTPATVALVNGRPHVVKARPGMTFRPVAVALGADARDRDLPTARLGCDRRSRRPSFTTADARRLGIRTQAVVVHGPPAPRLARLGGRRGRSAPRRDRAQAGRRPVVAGPARARDPVRLRRQRARDGGLQRGLARRSAGDVPRRGRVVRREPRRSGATRRCATVRTSRSPTTPGTAYWSRGGRRSRPHARRITDGHALVDAALEGDLGHGVPTHVVRGRPPGTGSSARPAGRDGFEVTVTGASPGGQVDHRVDVVPTRRAPSSAGTVTTTAGDRLSDAAPRRALQQLVRGQLDLLVPPLRRA